MLHPPPAKINTARRNPAEFPSQSPPSAQRDSHQKCKSRDSTASPNSDPIRHPLRVGKPFVQNIGPAEASRVSENPTYQARYEMEAVMSGDTPHSYDCQGPV
jgi:hypothetical protein